MKLLIKLLLKFFFIRYRTRKCRCEMYLFNSFHALLYRKYNRQSIREIL